MPDSGSSLSIRSTCRRSRGPPPASPAPTSRAWSLVNQAALKYETLDADQGDHERREDQTGEAEGQRSLPRPRARRPPRRALLGHKICYIQCLGKFCRN
ncbi:unnamed protein product [Colias eurytheme]|nr:unnamed protein product [Colias eurytheme]